jgi:hypothetical protein
MRKVLRISPGCLFSPYLLSLECKKGVEEGIAATQHPISASQKLLSTNCRQPLLTQPRLWVLRVRSCPEFSIEKAKRTQRGQKDGLAGNRTLDHSHAVSLRSFNDPRNLMLREYYTTKPQAQCESLMLDFQICEYIYRILSADD